jgi:hypothetical protein
MNPFFREGKNAIQVRKMMIIARKRGSSKSGLFTGNGFDTCITGLVFP